MCAHCKRDIQRGMVCGLTNEYADFEGDCPQFVASQHYLAQKRTEKTVSDNEADGGVNWPLLMVGIFCLFVPFFCHEYNHAVPLVFNLVGLYCVALIVYSQTVGRYSKVVYQTVVY